MKSFLVKYVSVLAILAFGFLGGVLFVTKDHVNEEILVQCEEEYTKAQSEIKECKENFVQLFFLYVELKEKGVKK